MRLKLGHLIWLCASLHAEPSLRAAVPIHQVPRPPPPPLVAHGGHLPLGVSVGGGDDKAGLPPLGGSGGLGALGGVEVGGSTGPGPCEVRGLSCFAQPSPVPTVDALRRIFRAHTKGAATPSGTRSSARALAATAAPRAKSTSTSAHQGRASTPVRRPPWLVAIWG